MEAVTAGATRAEGTGSKTIADLLPLAVKKYGDKAAQRYKVGDEWVDTSYAELGEAVKEIALGLVDLGIQPGDKVSILAHTRPEWTEASFGILTAGGTLVTIYQTNSPEECQYVLEHSDSRAIFAEDAEQLAKVREVEDSCPELEHVIVMDPSGADLGDALSLEQLRERGRGRDDSEWEARYQAVTPGRHLPLHLHVRHHGPAEGLPALARELPRDHGRRRGSEPAGGGRLVVPLPPARARLRDPDPVRHLRPRRDARLLVARPEDDHRGHRAGEADLLPVRAADVREDLHARHLATRTRKGSRRPSQVGVKVRMMREAGEEVPAELQQGFDQAEEKLFKNVRGLFGGNMRECVTGAAPIAAEILEFFYACGVPVMEGYGMTETSTSATVNRPEGNNFRFGSVGRPQKDVEVKIADDGEVLIKGPNIFQGYYKNEDATKETLENGWLHTGDLGRLDEDGFLYITGRKKDIIITAGGKNITPANLENGLKQNRWISQAVVIGDRRPYLVALVTLDPEEAPGARRAARDRGRRPGRPRAEREGARGDPEGDRRRELARGSRRADQALRDPRPRPLAGDRRAHADAEGQAQRGAREVRRRGGPDLRRAALASLMQVGQQRPD